MPKMFRQINYTGNVYNYLTVIETVHRLKHEHQIVIAKCKCGTIKRYRIENLINNNTKSCGCYKAGIFTTHGLAGHPIFSLWQNMKNRCYNKNIQCYERYGGRGIKVCNEWLHDFKAFYDWCIVNGWMEKLELDRRENNGDYEPLNCRFVTPQVNSNNRRDNVMLEFNGNKKSIAGWATELNMPYRTLHARIKDRKWAVEKALTIFNN